MTEERDVVIVGGGPAGATTALAFVHAAPELVARVVVLERARYPRDKPCAGALGARGDKLLASLGVRVDVPSVPLDGISFRGAIAEAIAAPGNIGRVVRRAEFDEALAAEARSRGVEIREGSRVEGVDGEHGFAVVRTSAGSLRARVVVGCDGVGSVVRRSMGIGAGRFRAQAVEVDTDGIPGDKPRTLLHFDASDRRLAGYAWDFPTLVDGRPLVCRGVYRLKVDGRPNDENDAWAVLEARLRAQGIDPSRCKNRRYAERGFEPALRVVDGPRMLVGEAAGIDPVTGEGIAQAIEYGVLAGRFLARSMAGGGARPLDAGGWQAELRRSRLARDLRVRTRFVDLFYGPSRPHVERFLTDTSDALHVGSQHFAAQPYDWPRVTEVVARGAAQILGSKIASWLSHAP